MRGCSNTRLKTSNKPLRHEPAVGGQQANWGQDRHVRSLPLQAAVAVAGCRAPLLHGAIVLLPVY